MLILGATPDEIREAAKVAGVRLRGQSSWRSGGSGDVRPSGRGYRVQLATVGARPKFRRLSRFCYGNGNRDNGQRRTIPGAVCWHGHRDFMRALYVLAPAAEIRTAFATYKGAAHFEESFRGTRGAMADDCECFANELAVRVGATPEDIERHSADLGSGNGGGR